MKYEMHADFMQNMLLATGTQFSFACTNIRISAEGGVCE